MVKLPSNDATVTTGSHRDVLAGGGEGAGMLPPPSDTQRGAACARGAAVRARCGCPISDTRTRRGLSDSGSWPYLDVFHIAIV